MKSVRLFCLALVLVLTVAHADAALLKFGIHGNLTNVNIGIQDNVNGVDISSELQKIYGLGYGGGIHFDISLPIISFRLSGDYVRLTPDIDQFRSLLTPFVGATIAQSINVDGGNINVIFGQANLKFNLLPLPVISVYLTGGAGIVNLEVSEAKISASGTQVYTLPSDSQTKASLNAGAGVDISLGGISLFGEARVTWILTEGKTTTMVPIGTVGITF